MNRPNQLAVSKIEVIKLFGNYTYSIPNNENTDISKLLIIYGDNGTGKTTILKLFFYLLSTRDKSGYKTRLAETKFEKFSVGFQNGLEIGAVRKSASLGSYEFYIKKNDTLVKSLFLKALPDNSIQILDDTVENATYKWMLNYLRKLNIATFYLSDDRKILNSITSDQYENDGHRVILSDSDLIYSKDYENMSIKKMLNERKLALEPTIERLIDWVRNKIISGSRWGLSQKWPPVFLQSGHIFRSKVSTPFRLKVSSWLILRPFKTLEMPSGLIDRMVLRNGILAAVSA